MALVNPSNLYSGGQVRLDSNPYRIAYQQQQLRRQAKDEALDKYYQNLPNTINAAGVRDQEVPVINQAKDELAQFWIKNKEAIKKGNTPANYNYQKMIRGVQGIIQESKNRAENTRKLTPYLVDPKYAYVRKDTRLMGIIASNDLPIGAEGSTGFNYSDLLVPPPPFDQQKYMRGVTAKPNPLTPTYQDIPDDKFNRIEITEKGFSPEDLNNVHIYASGQMDNDVSFSEFIKEKVVQDPVLSKGLGELFEKHYGHKIENEGDLATAWTLAQMDLTPTQKRVPNTEALFDARNQEARDRLYLQDALIRKRAKDNPSSNPDLVDINDVFTAIDQTTQDPNTPAILVNGQKFGTRINALNSDGQSVVLDFTRKLTGKNDFGNDDGFIDKTPDGRIAIYRVQKGKPYKKDESTPIGYLPRVGTNLKAQPSVKEKRTVIQQGNNPTPSQEGDLDGL